MSERFLLEANADEVLAELDFATPDVGALDEALRAPEVIGSRRATVSPTVTRAFELVVKQSFMRPDGSGDRNFPEINAFNSAS